MSLQTILESSPIAKWITTEPSPDLLVAQPSAKVISFEADRGEGYHSAAANTVANIFATAHEGGHLEIAIRRTKVAEEIWFDRRCAGRIDPAESDSVERRLLFLSGYLDYPPKPLPHQIRLYVHGKPQLWECRKKAKSIEMRRLS